jgi:hypothetical protein
MTKVAILPLSTTTGEPSFCAVAGEKQSRGATAGEALDALMAQLPVDDAGTLIILQNLRPDRFFGASQQARLAELMGRWRVAQDRGESLAPDEQVELDSLVQEELAASAARAGSLADELER